MWHWSLLLHPAADEQPLAFAFVWPVGFGPNQSDLDAMKIVIDLAKTAETVMEYNKRTDTPK